MNPAGTSEKMRIHSPEKVTRLLEKVERSGLPLIIRSLISPGVSVKGRAVPKPFGSKELGLMVGNISQRGLEFLSKNTEGLVQVEFILTSQKIKFVSSINKLNFQTCLLNLPKYLESLERRQYGRFGTNEKHRAFISFGGLNLDGADPRAAPVFGSSRNFCDLFPVADISFGGVGISSHFPIIADALGSTDSHQHTLVHLPMSAPIPAAMSLLWTKIVRTDFRTFDAQTRTATTYKCGFKFLESSENLTRQLNAFIERLSLADAI